MNSFVWGIALTFVAGFLDAACFTYLSGLYVSFMSGNSAGLGIAIDHRNMPFVGAAGLAAVCFVVGVFVGSATISSTSKTWAPAIILCQSALLLLTVAVIESYGAPWSVVPLCFAMGLQNAVPRQVAGVEVGRGFVTGALFGVGHSLAQALQKPGQLAGAAVHFATWISLVVGAVVGSACLSRLGLTVSIIICAAITFACASFDILALFIEQPKSEKVST
jgi:oxalate decarboxylase